jgi:tetratricopeptide (TPR) repeat protein/predicted Ser/Thr protein kinase
VAIKMLRASIASEETARRLTREARILQKLQHPAIARMLHAGWTGQGSAREPYVVMEYVEGRSITKTAEEKGWTRDQRLTAFLAVCEAVAYAHRRGVIHRDLKPGNVLVDPAGTPKVVDFGLASLVEPDAATRLTVSGQVLGTLPYISPEQLERDTDVSDTRSDVYALGVMLFELLAGRAPIDVSALPAAIAIQRLREAGPPSLAAADPSLGGDLETVVQRAMSREVEARYQTVDELAADLRRYMADEPILARPPTLAERLRRFGRRNPTLVAAGLVAVLAGVIIVWQARLSAHRSEKLRGQAELRTIEAERERNVALSVSTILQDMLQSPRAEGLGREARVAEVLDAAAQRLDASPPRYPEVEWAVARTLSAAYRELALHDRAVAYADRAASAGEKAFGRVSAARAAALVELARAYESAGQFDRAMAAAREASETAGPAGANAELVDAMTVEGRVLVSDVRLDDAAPVLDSAMAIARRLPASADDARVATLTVELARLALDRRAATKALALIDGLNLPEPGVGVPLPYRAAAVRVKVAALAALSRFPDALPIASRELAWAEARLAPGHPSLVRARCALAAVLLAQAKPGDAAELAGQALAAALPVLGPTHQATLEAVELAAAAWRASGKPDRADDAVDSVLARLDEADVTHLPAILQLRRTQIAGSCDAGRFTEADQIFDQTQQAVQALEPLGPSVRHRVDRLLEACDVLRESRRPTPGPTTAPR